MPLASSRRLLNSLLGQRLAEEPPTQAALPASTAEPAATPTPRETRDAPAPTGADAPVGDDASVDSRVMQMLAAAPGFNLDRLLILDLACIAQSLTETNAKAMARIDKLAMQVIGETLTAKDRTVPLGTLRHMLLVESIDREANHQLAGRILRQLATKTLGEAAGSAELWFEVVTRDSAGDLGLETRKVAAPGSAEAALEDALHEDEQDQSADQPSAAAQGRPALPGVTEPRDQVDGPGAEGRHSIDAQGDGAGVDAARSPAVPASHDRAETQTDVVALTDWLDEDTLEPDWGVSQDRAEATGQLVAGASGGRADGTEPGTWTAIPGTGEAQGDAVGLGTWQPIAPDAQGGQQRAAAAGGPQQITDPWVGFEPLFSPQANRVVGYRALLRVSADGRSVRLDESDLGLPITLLDRLDERLHREALAGMSCERQRGRPAMLRLPVRLSYLQRGANARRFYSRIHQLPPEVRAQLGVEVFGVGTQTMTFNGQLPLSTLRTVVKEISFAVPLSGGPFRRLASSGAKAVTLSGFGRYRTSKAIMLAEPTINRARQAGLRVWVADVHSRFALKVLADLGIAGMTGSVICPPVDLPYGQIALDELKALTRDGVTDLNVAPA